MSRSDSRRSWKIVLIVEDDSDGKALQHLARNSGIDADIDWLPANGIGNIKRKGDKLIRLARDRFRHGTGCVAVVVDRDGKNAATDEPYRTIAQQCRELRVPYVEAIEALEAWFLADPGICSWLSLSPPSGPDGIRDPKSRVGKAFYKKTKRSYRKRRARPQVARQSSGVQESPSWHRAMEHLASCPVERVIG